MSEKTLTANGIQIWTEDFGNPSDPATLLIMGATAQGLRWPDEMVEGLVAAGRYVVCYDNRDVGQSTSFDFASNPYGLEDLAADAVGVLDGYGIETAHVVGASMGGMVVQILMAKHRDRLRTATIIMSSPLSGGGQAVPEFAGEGLPGPRQGFMEELAAKLAPADTLEGQITLRVGLFESLFGTAEPFDREGQRALAQREIERARDFSKMSNHMLVVAQGEPTDRRPSLASVDVPTLVVHGTEDPIFPFPHGKALADTIPGAELLTLERAGHEMPQIYLKEMVARMVALSAEPVS